MSESACRLLGMKDLSNLRMKSVSFQNNSRFVFTNVKGTITWGKPILSRDFFHDATTTAISHFFTCRHLKNQNMDVLEFLTKEDLHFSLKTSKGTLIEHIPPKTGLLVNTISFFKTRRFFEVQTVEVDLFVPNIEQETMTISTQDILKRANLLELSIFLSPLKKAIEFEPAETRKTKNAQTT